MGNDFLYRLLACLLAWSFISVSLADEFKLQFSKDFMEAESRQFLSGGESDSDDSQDKDLPISSSLKPANTSTFHPADSGFSKKSTSLETAQTPNQAGSMFDSGLLVEHGATQQLISSQEQSDAESFAQIREDLRELVGDEVYSKMIWAYRDFKELDHSIYAELSQYEVIVQEWLVEVQEIFGLNDQLRAELILPETPDAEASRLRVAAIQSQHDTTEDNLASRLKADSLNQATVVDFEVESKLFQIIKYITIKNFLYLLLSILGAVYCAKFFKFLVRQQ